MKIIGGGGGNCPLPPTWRHARLIVYEVKIKEECKKAVLTRRDREFRGQGHDGLDETAPIGHHHFIERNYKDRKNNSLDSFSNMV